MGSLNGFIWLMIDTTGGLL